MKIVIVGGGTAGVMASLAFNKMFPQYDVTLIDSSKIGIAGVGEGTTQNFYKLLTALEIDTADMVAKTGSYFKAGFKFTNWTKEEPRSFVHPFFNDFMSGDQLPDENLMYDLVDAANYFDGNIDRLSEVNMTLLKNELIEIGTEYPIFGKTVRKSEFAWHIDANLFADYIKEIAISRGVKHIDKVVSDFEKNEITGNVDKVVFEDGETLDADFVIDSTGFARKIIGKLYGTKWISMKQYLPNDRAIPFGLFNKEPVPYSNSQAMNNGWIWEIPLQHRYGCGYVFSSAHATDEEIIAEIHARYGEENVKLNKPISFDPGYFEQIWVNNVLALGLSSSFFEPLEATSIQFSLNALKIFLDDYFVLYQYAKDKQMVRDDFNRVMREINDGVAAFVNLHYVTDKDDTQYWRDIRNNYEVHPLTLEAIDKIRNRESLRYREYRVHFPSSWITVYSGNHMYKNKELVVDKAAELLYNDRVKEVESFSAAIPAKDFLNKIMEKK